MAEKWPDDTTRKLLTEWAVLDTNNSTRNVALKALAMKWPDETTRKLLEDRAVQDESVYTRSVALKALAKKWPGETTRKLLQDYAADKGSDSYHRHAFIVSLGEMHSNFGRIVYTSRLNGPPGAG